MKEIKSLPVKRQVSVSGILKKLGVSRSGYNAWKKRVPSDTSVRRAVLKEKIQKIYEESHQNYGAPKITAELRKSGEYVSEKTVGNYMRQMGIKAHWVKPYIQTTIDSDFSQKLKNILNEEFNPAHPDAVWCSDITYIGTFEGFVYLTSVMDLYSRKIISWVLSETLEASHVVECVEKAKRVRFWFKITYFERNTSMFKSISQYRNKSVHITCIVESKAEFSFWIYFILQ